jgi:hypothetical protein
MPPNSPCVGREEEKKKKKKKGTMNDGVRARCNALGRGNWIFFDFDESRKDVEREEEEREEEEEERERKRGERRRNILVLIQRPDVADPLRVQRVHVRRHRSVVGHERLQRLRDRLQLLIVLRGGAGEIRGVHGLGGGGRGGGGEGGMGLKCLVLVLHFLVLLLDPLHFRLLSLEQPQEPVVIGGERHP